MPEMSIALYSNDIPALPPETIDLSHLLPLPLARVQREMLVVKIR